MLFTSYEFLLFVGVLLVLYYTIPKKMQWILLTLASYIFYGLSGPGYLIFILITTITAYLTAVLMDRNAKAESKYLEANRDLLSKDKRKTYRAGQKKRRFYILIAGLLAGFGLLAVMKYTAFAVVNINFVLGRFGAEGLNILNILRCSAFHFTHSRRWGISSMYTAAALRPSATRLSSRFSSPSSRS